MATTEPKITGPDWSLRRDQRGAGLVEYALLLALMAVACLVALNAFGVTNGGSINNTADSYASATN